MKPYGAKRTGQVWKRGLRRADSLTRLELSLDHIKHQRGQERCAEKRELTQQVHELEDERQWGFDGGSCQIYRGECFPGCDCVKCSRVGWVCECVSCQEDELLFRDEAGQ